MSTMDPGDIISDVKGESGRLSEAVSDFALSIQSIEVSLGNSRCVDDEFIISLVKSLKPGLGGMCLGTTLNGMCVSKLEGEKRVQIKFIEEVEKVIKVLSNKEDIP